MWNISLFGCSCLLSFVWEINAKELPFNHLQWMAAKRFSEQIGFMSRQKSHEVFCDLFSLPPFLSFFFFFVCVIVQTFSLALRIAPLRWFGIRGFSYSTYYVAWWDSISRNQRGQQPARSHTITWQPVFQQINNKSAAYCTSQCKLTN